MGERVTAVSFVTGGSARHLVKECLKWLHQAGVEGSRRADGGGSWLLCGARLVRCRRREASRGGRRTDAASAVPASSSNVQAPCESHAALKAWPPSASPRVSQVSFTFRSAGGRGIPETDAIVLLLVRTEKNSVVLFLHVGHFPLGSALLVAPL